MDTFKRQPNWGLNSPESVRSQAGGRLLLRVRRNRLVQSARWQWSPKTTRLTFFPCRWLFELSSRGPPDQHLFVKCVFLLFFSPSRRFPESNEICAKALPSDIDMSSSNLNRAESDNGVVDGPELRLRFFFHHFPSASRAIPAPFLEMIGFLIFKPRSPSVKSPVREKTNKHLLCCVSPPPPPRRSPFTNAACCWVVLRFFLFVLFFWLIRGWILFDQWWITFAMINGILPLEKIREVLHDFPITGRTHCAYCLFSWARTWWVSRYCNFH